MAIVKTAQIFFRQFRVSEWSKNGFLFAGALFAGKIFELQVFWRATEAFLLFCLLASVVYVFNDWIDADMDRHHPVKKLRPLAAGDLKEVEAKILLLFLTPLTLYLSFVLNETFFLWALSYLLLNVAYTLFLKKVIVLDVLTVSANYLIRLMAGAAAVEVPVTQWFLIASTLLALFMAVGKRRFELNLLGDSSEAHRTVLGTYRIKTLDIVMIFVSLITIVVYILYAFDPRTKALLHTLYMPLTIPFVIIGLVRYIQLVRIGKIGDNPARNLFTDAVLLSVTLAWLLTVVAILYFSRQ